MYNAGIEASKRSQSCLQLLVAGGPPNSSGKGDTGVVSLAHPLEGQGKMTSCAQSLRPWGPLPSGPALQGPSRSPCAGGQLWSEVNLLGGAMQQSFRSNPDMTT